MKKARQTQGWQRLTHHTVRLDDGHRVGITTGGQGIPLVFLHGIAMNTIVYARVLSRLGALGFRIIAIDAAAHGRTAPLVRTDFRSNIDLLVRTLDKLGIQRAVVVGHSMGGRAAIELAANHPERLLAAVLLDAAAGDAFDAYTQEALRSRRVMARGVAAALYDTTADWWRCGGWRDRGVYGLSMTRALTRWSTRPRRLAAAIRAVAHSAPTGQLLRQARNNGVKVIVVHAQKDTVVPWANAVSMAENAGASLYCVPRAYHSWILADPRQGAKTLAALIHMELSELGNTTATSSPPRARTPRRPTGC